MQFENIDVVEIVDITSSEYTSELSKLLLDNGWKLLNTVQVKNENGAYGQLIFGTTKVEEQLFPIAKAKRLAAANY